MMRLLTAVRPLTILVFLLSVPVAANAAGANAAAQTASNAGAQAIVVNGGGGGGSQTIRNTPALAPPPVYAGTNPCLGAASGGVSVAGFGIAAGGTHPDDDCRLRNWYVVMMQSAQATHDPEYVRWARGIACAANPVLRQVAPPGMCDPVPAKVAQVAPLDLAKPVPRAEPSHVAAAPQKVMAKNAPAFCHYPSLAWQAYPKCVAQ